jgi:hypothetical protein
LRILEHRMTLAVSISGTTRFPDSLRIAQGVGVLLKNSTPRQGKGGRRSTAPAVPAAALTLFITLITVHPESGRKRPNNAENQGLMTGCFRQPLLAAIYRDLPILAATKRLWFCVAVALQVLCDGCVSAV